MRMARSSNTIACAGACWVNAVSAWAKSIFAAEFFGGAGLIFAGFGGGAGLLLFSAVLDWPELARLSETLGPWLPAQPPMKMMQSKEIQSFMFTKAHTVIRVNC